jgi:hypothetical protein
MKNSLNPTKMAEAVISAHQSSATQILIAAEEFAKAWEAYSNKEWGNQQLETFLDLLFEGGVGANPNDTILRERETIKEPDKYTLSGASTFSYLKSVGEHPLFKDKNVRDACRVNGLTVLYNLVLLHKAIVPWEMDSDGVYIFRDSKEKVAEASETIISLLSKGGDLTVREVKEETAKYQKKVRAYNKRKAPIERETGKRKFAQVKGGEYDNVVLTPSDDFMADIQGMTLSSIRDDFDFDELVSDDGSLSIATAGNRVEAALKLGKAIGKSNLNLFVLKTSDKANAATILNLSNETIIASTKQNLSARVGKTKGEARVRAAVGVSENKSNLHLFSSSEIEGWDTCETVDD